MTRLYIGCGDNYREGYVNIDADDRGGTCKVDVVSPIEFISYPKDSVDEILAEHVLEHFPRWMAELLLLEWHGWLKPGGSLVLLMPDFERTVLDILQADNEERRCFLYRHIFGNHTSWYAPHMDGYTADKLRWMLTRHGYTIEGAMISTRYEVIREDRSDLFCRALKADDIPDVERRASMLAALEHNGEMDFIRPAVDEYLAKIDGSTNLPMNWWLRRYTLKEATA